MCEWHATNLARAAAADDALLLLLLLPRDATLVASSITSGASLCPFALPCFLLCCVVQTLEELQRAVLQLQLQLHLSCCATRDATLRLFLSHAAGGQCLAWAGYCMCHVWHYNLVCGIIIPTVQHLLPLYVPHILFSKLEQKAK